jgi:NAD(P)-dependent dehydrogenase (short-subunit alcohol dehydrogenase family)
MGVDLRGAAALVTGGATGLGRAFVEELTGRGARVLFTFSQSAPAAGSLIETLERQGRTVASVRADVTRTIEVEAAVAETLDRFGALDILVNNAGTTQWIPMHDLEAADDDAWHGLLDVNLVGAFRCVRAAAPHLRAREGSILNVASNSAFSGSGSSIPYVVSKAALVSLTGVLAQVLAPDVRVNAVAPGWMDTEWLPRHIPPDVAERLRIEQPFVDLGDVARVGVELLASKAVTGQTIVLDRGESLGASQRGTGRV